MYFHIVSSSLLFLHIIVISYFIVTYITQTVLSTGHSLGLKFFHWPQQVQPRYIIPGA